jgi:hypothetical protein
MTLTTHRTDSCCILSFGNVLKTRNFPSRMGKMSAVCSACQYNVNIDISVPRQCV